MKTVIINAPQTELTITSVRANRFRETATKLQRMALELDRMGGDRLRIERLERAMKLLLRSTAEAMVEQADQEEAELPEEHSMIDLTKRESMGLPDECVLGAEYVFIHPSAVVGDEGETRAGMFISMWRNTARPGEVFHVKEVHAYEDGKVAYVTTFAGYEYLIPHNGGFRLEISTSWPSPS